MQKFINVLTLYRHLVFDVNSRSRVRSIVVTTSNGLDGQQMQDFSLLHNVQTGSGAHPASYPMGTGATSPELKRSGREADHYPPSSADIKNELYSHSPICLDGVVLN
jgi:hypothetical protein